MTALRSSALLLLVAAGFSCRAAKPQEGRTPPPEAERAAAERKAIGEEAARERTQLDPSAGLRAEASSAIENGDFDRARDLLGELLAGTHVERARELAERKDAAGALAALDRALEVAPHSRTILCARGEAALAMADSSRTSGGRSEADTALLESALGNFLEVARSESEDLHVRAWLGASRAARALGLAERALEYARRGVQGELLSAQSIVFAVPLRRTLAEASYDVFLGAERQGATADALRDRARESRDALVGLLGRTPEDPWPWERLAELHRAQGAAEEARDVALRGLSIAPDDPSLLEGLSLAARKLGGARAVLAAFEPFCRRHPDVAMAAWHLAEARFDLSADHSKSGVDPRAELAAAEAGFARSRALDPALEERSRAMEARCRGMLGAWLLDRGDVEGARDAFLSMEDSIQGGLALEIGGTSGQTLQRGSDGLLRVAQAYAERGDAGSPESIDHLEQAARIFDLLHAANPDDARFAFGAGHANREAAVALALQAESLVRGSTAERNRLLERARELMERGFLALDDAARLAPEDARVAAEAGAVLVRYLQREPERARTFLENAVRLGETKVRAFEAHAGEPNLGESERAARRLRLEEAQTLVGDACLDLGTLHIALLNEPERAREWLDRSRRAGPDPRQEIDALLERCRAAIAGELDPRISDASRWAAPVGPSR